MPRMKAVRVLLIVLLLASCAAAQSVREEILKTYDFQPHSLSKDQIAQKSSVLDQFWAKAKADPAVYVPALREQLSDLSSPPFFLYDGSALLLSLSDKHTDRVVALAAMAHCDLRDVQEHDYFLQVHRLAALGEDTTAAALHVLEQPKFQVFIPLHVLTLGQNYVLIYLLLPTDQKFWLDPAIDRLKIEHDPTAQKSLLLLLWYAQTNEADRALTAFFADAKQPKDSRDYAQQLLRRESAVDAKVKERARAMTEAGLREKRRQRLSAVSDEALDDLDDYTLLLMAKRQ